MFIWNYYSLKWKDRQNSQVAYEKALITGITVQDGSYLAELLLHKGYEVHAIIKDIPLEN